MGPSPPSSIEGTLMSPPITRVHTILSSCEPWQSPGQEMTTKELKHHDREVNVCLTAECVCPQPRFGFVSAAPGLCHSMKGLQSSLRHMGSF